MVRSKRGLVGLIVATGMVITLSGALAQPPREERPRGPGPEFGPPPQGGRRGGFGGPGGPGRAERKLVDEFDKNDDGWLNSAERSAARSAQPAEQPRGGFGRRFPGGRENREPPQPGPRITPQEVTNYPDADLYDPSVLRTLFLEFENEDWEQELSDFYNTDVDVPAILIVDGVKYPNVGVRFRGQRSYFMVPSGYKRSLNLSLDLVDDEQRLDGFRTLNLLNLHGDETMMSTVLYSRIAQQYLPAPRANFVRLVINGEYWGIYTSAEQFNKDFLDACYGSPEGARWKNDGSPRGDGGLRYLGEDVEPYRQRFDIKSADRDESWRDLVKLCRTLDETPPEQLEAALRPMLDVDSVLWFLALDIALVNSDGYWTRASDYSLYQDPQGRFHLIPHDMNEAFRGNERGPGRRDRGRRSPPDGEVREGRPPGPPGAGFPGGGFPGFGGPRAGGVTLDPTVVLDDQRMPLRSKLLAVPELRARYLRCVRTIAEQSLDWNNLGPDVAQLRELIRDDVAAETRSQTPLEAFLQATDDQPSAEQSEAGPMSLRTFADRRREYLLEQTKSAEDVAAPPVWREEI